MKAIEQVVEETGFLDKACCLTLDWLPVKPKSLKGTVNRFHVRDDGKGTLTVSRGSRKAVSGFGSINYKTGLVTMRVAKPGWHYSLNYQFSSEQPKDPLEKQCPECNGSGADSLNDTCARCRGLGALTRCKTMLYIKLRASPAVRRAYKKATGKTLEQRYNEMGEALMLEVLSTVLQKGIPK